MTNNDLNAQTLNSLETLIRSAEDRLRIAEQNAALAPQLRREIKALKKAHAGLVTGPAPRRRSGPTIKDSIFEALENAGGRIDFGPGEMLKTVHALTGGKPNSVQVEIHRLRDAGRLGADFDHDNKPISLFIVRPPLTAIAGGAVG